MSAIRFEVFFEYPETLPQYLDVVLGRFSKTEIE
jgi:hypothetical protein